MSKMSKLTKFICEQVNVSTAAQLAAIRRQVSVQSFGKALFKKLYNYSFVDFLLLMKAPNNINLIWN